MLLLDTIIICFPCTYYSWRNCASCFSFLGFLFVGRDAVDGRYVTDPVLYHAYLPLPSPCPLPPFPFFRPLYLTHCLPCHPSPVLAVLGLVEYNKITLKRHRKEWPGATVLFLFILYYYCTCIDRRQEQETDHGVLYV